MKIDFYQIDTFTDQVFKGNAAGVCPLDKWLEDDLLLNIAAENNLSETAFFVSTENRFEIRWFTPQTEVDLCGHATLASAYVIFNHMEYNSDSIEFYSPRSGKLAVTKTDNEFLLNFPIDELSAVELNELLLTATDKIPVLAFKGTSDYMLVFQNEQEVAELSPNLEMILKLQARGLIVTAKGSSCDFVSRFFGPAVGVAEDPVTGSAHTTLIPYWAKQIGKSEMTAKQISQRGGILSCHQLDTRVEIGGQAVLYLKGEVYI